jgi:adenine/guanine phosphoribosyltransferase-like PRPP-binding protein
MEPIPAFAGLIQQFLRRTDWDDFPDVVIHYVTAKSGDADAADKLASVFITPSILERLVDLVGSGKPHLLAVTALETISVNAIARVLAIRLGQQLDLPIAKGIIQVNRVSHTGSDGYHRLALPALFDGVIEAQGYVMVDDFIGQGGTLANLKGYVESAGAKVLGATVLTGKAYSAKLRLSEETLQMLRAKYGNELEQWWLATFGYGFERLTESEARYLSRAGDADSITTRIVAAMGE